MSSPIHANQVQSDGIHTPITWTFADASARAAFSPTAGSPSTSGALTSVDMYKFAVQLDENTIWILTSITPLEWTSLGAGTGGGSGTGDGDSKATYIVLSTTGSLTSERVLNVSGSSGLIATDGGSGGSLSLSINDNVVATLSGSRFSGPVNADGGLTGSLQRLSTGETYLAAGTNITIATSSTGQITISSTLEDGGGDSDRSASYLVLSSTGSLTNERVFSTSGSSGLIASDDNQTFSLSVDPTAYTSRTFASGNYADPNPSYLLLNTTASLPNERVLSVSGTSGLRAIDSGDTLSLSINDSVVATLSGSTFSGPIQANGGLSGSLQQISPGLSYLVAGENVSITSQSNGQIIISSTDAMALVDWIDGGSRLKTTASVSLSGEENVYAEERGVDTYFYVSGTQGTEGSTAKKAVFSGDVRISGSLTVGTGSIKITSNDIQFGGPESRIERVGSDIRIYDVNNPEGYTLAQLAAGSGDGGSGDSNPSFLVLNATASLPNERVLSVSGSSGLIAVDGAGTLSLSINDGIVATLSGAVFQGRTSHEGGLTGSLQLTPAGTSYLVAGDNVTIVSGSGPNGQIVISATVPAPISATDNEPSYLVLNATASLPNERVLSVSGTSGLRATDSGGTLALAINDSVVATLSGSTFTGVISASGGLSGSLQFVGPGLRYLVPGNNGLEISTGSNGQVTVTINDSVVATLSGSRYTGPINAAGGLTGSLQRTPDGTSYLVAGNNVTITSGSGTSGQIVISANVGSGQGGEPNATYLLLTATGSLSNERVFSVSGSSGLRATDTGAGGTLSLTIDDNVVATLSGATYTGPINAGGGLSGSLQQTTNGISFLVAGSNITITSESNGQVTIASSGGSSTVTSSIGYAFQAQTSPPVTASVGGAGGSFHALSSSAGITPYFATSDGRSTTLAPFPTHRQVGSVATGDGNKTILTIPVINNVFVSMGARIQLWNAAEQYLVAELDALATRSLGGDVKMLFPVNPSVYYSTTSSLHTWVTASGGNLIAVVSSSNTTCRYNIEAWFESRSLPFAGET